jgi:hypothetical protein
MEGHLLRVPAANTCQIASTVFGPESFTPDNKPLIGPDPKVKGFFHACGASSSGIMMGGGIGREVSTWIDEGSPELDMFGHDVRRFHPECVHNANWVRDRCAEGYTNKYVVLFPHDETLAGRNIRTSGMHDELVARGCIF